MEPVEDSAPASLLVIPAQYRRLELLIDQPLALITPILAHEGGSTGRHRRGAATPAAASANRLCVRRGVPFKQAVSHRRLTLRNPPRNPFREGWAHQQGATLARDLTG